MTNRNPSMLSCPSCGASASGKFCNQCGASLGVGGCRQCRASLEPGARFCNECGTAVSGQTAPVASVGGYAPADAPSGGAAKYAPWAVAAIILVSVLGYFAGKGAGSGGDGGAPLASDAQFAPFANGGGGPAPDISNMSPRERASRLYDRIMRYAEEGKKDSMQVFAPMALSSFEMLGADLDIDARYDYGRVASETGNYEIASAQADTILRQSPNHLLGLALSARTATARGDTSGAAKTWKAFLAARDAELKKPLPEYQMHASDIEQATQLAQGR